MIYIFGAFVLGYGGFGIWVIWKNWQHRKMVASLKAGDQFVLYSRKTTPWNDRNIYAEIVEVKDGWVRYIELKYPDDVREATIDKFLFVYKPKIQSEPVGSGR